MRRIWPIAIITFKEGIRDKTIYGISLLALLLFIVNLIISEMFMRDIGKVTVDLTLSTISLSGLLLVLFIGINLIGKDLDKKTVYTILSRPFSRADYLFGKFTGITLIIVLSIPILSIFGVISLSIVKLRFGKYFLHFSWYPFLIAIILIIFSLILLTSLSLLFSSFTSSSFITLIFTIISYIIGNSIEEVKSIVEVKAMGVETNPIINYIIKIAYYMFPNLSLFNVKIQAAHGLNIPFSYLLWVIIYGIIYTTISLLIGCVLFRRREFP
jgi:ABC-type transport system involved in multi-copper enzyme maturation permease subunit